MAGAFSALTEYRTECAFGVFSLASLSLFFVAVLFVIRVVYHNINLLSLCFALLVRTERQREQRRCTRIIIYMIDLCR